jgi:hypothetical protein
LRYAVIASKEGEHGVLMSLKGLVTRFLMLTRHAFHPIVTV